MDRRRRDKFKWTQKLLRQDRESQLMFSGQLELLMQRTKYADQMMELVRFRAR